MPSEIISYEIPKEQVPTSPTSEEDFSTKREQEFKTKYNLTPDQNITELSNVIKILSHPKLKDQIQDISTLLVSFPFHDITSLNNLYNTISQDLSDTMNFRVCKLNPLDYIRNICGNTKTQIEIQQKIEEKQRFQQEVYNTFLSEYNNTQAERNTLSKKFDKSITLDKLNPSDLKIFQDVFVYELTSKNKPLTPQAQQDINTKILSYIRYQAYLRQQKPEQLTTTQRSQKEYFEKFLDNSGINNEDFFG